MWHFNQLVGNMRGMFGRAEEGGKSFASSTGCEPTPRSRRRSWTCHLVAIDPPFLVSSLPRPPPPSLTIPAASTSQIPTQTHSSRSTGPATITVDFSTVSGALRSAQQISGDTNTISPATFLPPFSQQQTNSRLQICETLERAS